MKKRYNITVEYEVMEEAKRYLLNVSKYLETCLIRFNQQQKLEESKKKFTKEQIEIIREVNLWD